MTKKILSLLFAGILLVSMLTVQVFAERKTELPAMLEQDAYGERKVEVKSFEVTKVENLSGKYLNRVYFNIEYNDLSGYGDLYMVFICYDAQGMPLKTVDFNSYLKYIDVPDTTAMLELTMEKPTAASQSYFYCKYVNVYAPDGRVMGITDLQVPVYELVGWKRAVTMYALDGRTLDISPFEVAAYEAVGWYTAEGMVYYEVQKLYNEYKAAGDYNSILMLVDVALESLAGTKYEQSLYAIRTEAMDAWRKSSGAPMGVIDYATGENSIGTPEVTIAFRNLSYKKIIAYKIKFTCYDVFGNVERAYYDYYFVDDANMEPAGAGEATWTIYGADSVHTVKNIRITEVVFSDYTKWTGK